MHLMINILVVFVATTNAISFLSDEWTENVRQFFQQTHRTIDEKSNEFLNGLLNFHYCKIIARKK